MREVLINFDVLYFLTAITCIAVLLNFVGFLLYRKLLRDSNQMGTTDNRWMKSMMAKFEAYYKLRISVHNVENFVDRYLYHYHFFGLSLQTWENMDRYAVVVTLASTLLFALAAGYYQLSAEWFMVLGFCAVALLFLQGVASLLFNIHRSRKILRIQLIDYMENTMRARLENEYFNKEATREYQMEYFDEEGKSPGQAAAAMEQEETEDRKLPHREAGGRNAKRAALQREEQEFRYRNGEVGEGLPARADSQEAETAVQEEYYPSQRGSSIRELLNCLIEELKIDKDIEKKQQQITEYTASASERAQLFEEILKEYI